MKIKKVFVYDKDLNRIYKGQLLGLSYERKAIIDTCIELFDDDSPCIIHESYAIQTLADHVEKVCLAKNKKTFVIEEKDLEHLPMLSRMYQGCTFEIEVKK